MSTRRTMLFQLLTSLHGHLDSPVGVLNDNITALTDTELVVLACRLLDVVKAFRPEKHLNIDWRSLTVVRQ